ncbi:MAG: hypothetical protein IT385_11010 [Deltaproteobacteria bacterium]|nr:hypothetical protein [Deltaproteobacteria bacterium]
MHVVIADTLPPEIVSSLEALGYRVSANPDLDPSVAVKDADVLVVARSRVTRRVIEAGTRLKAILRAGVGVETIDLVAASERGVTVAHCPGADVHARAEHALGLVLALDRGLGGGRAGALGLRGRTLGLVGFDGAARALQAAAGALGMRVLVWDPALTPALAAEAGVHRADGLDALFSRADIVSLHVPESAGVVVTRERLGKLPAGATLVNVGARGLIDLAALGDALAAGQIRVGIDVYDADDYGDDVPFAADAHPGLIATFRQAGRTHQCDDAVGHAVVRALEVFLSDRVLPDAANLGAGAGPGGATGAGHPRLVVRHRNDPGVLPGIFEALQEQGATIAGVEGRGFEGGVATLLRIELTLPATPTLIDEVAGLAGVLGVEAY